MINKRKLRKAVKNTKQPQVTPHSQSLGVGFRLTAGEKR